jgi:hypothetical protein
MTYGEILKEYKQLDPELQAVIRHRAYKRLHSGSYKFITSDDINKEITYIYKDYCGFRNVIDEEIQTIYTHDYAGI